VWQAGLQQLRSSSSSSSGSAKAAAWLNNSLLTTAGLMLALYIGSASKGMTAEAALNHVNDVCNDLQKVHHFTEQQALEIAAEAVQPALDAAAAANARGCGGLVQLSSLWAEVADVVCMGHAAASAPVLQAMLQLQQQLGSEPAETFTAPQAACHFRSNLERQDPALWLWGGAMGAVLDLQQLHVTLGWLAASYNGRRLPAACTTLFLGGAVHAAVESDVLTWQGSSFGDTCSRAVAAHGGVLDTSIRSRVQFLSEVLRAAQQAAEQPDGALLDAGAVKALVVFAEQHRDEVNLQQLLPAKLSTRMLQQLLEACQDASALTGAVAQHVLEHASDAQLQQLPVRLLQLEGVQLLHAPAASQLVSSGAAAALLLKVLAAALQSQADGILPEPCVKQNAALLLQAVCGRRSDSAASESDLLLSGPQAFKLPFTDVHAWLRQLGQSLTGPAAPTVSELLHELLQQSMVYELPRKQQWQLYQLLLELQQQSDWQRQGLIGLTAGACDALIQQQRQPAWYGTGASSVLQLLQHAAGDGNSSSTAEQDQFVPLQVYDQLSSVSRSVVLAALVRLAHHTDALQLVQQAPQGNPQLPALLQLWAAQLRQAQQAGAADATMYVSDDEGEPQQQQQQQQQTQLASQVAARVRGSTVTLPVLQQALAVALQGSQLQLSGQVVQLMQQAAPNSSMPELFAAGQLEQYLLLLCKDSSSSSFATAAELVAACVDSSAPVQFSVSAVAAYASAAAAAGAGSASQQLLQMAELPVLVAAAMQLARQQNAAPLQLLLSLVLSTCSNGRMPAAQWLQQLTDSDLQQLLSLLCRSAAGMCIAEQLALMWLDSGRQLPLGSALSFLEGCGQASPHLQPPAAAAALGLVQPAQLEAAAAAAAAATGTSSQQHADVNISLHPSQEDVGRAVASTQLVARVCHQLCQTADQLAAAGGDAESSLDTSWVGRMSGPAAAVALFSCWAWQQQQQQQQHGSDVLLLLYHASRQASGSSAKPRLDGLLLDLGLAAAARNENWEEGKF
jgi:hypothetical protein